MTADNRTLQLAGDLSIVGAAEQRERLLGWMIAIDPARAGPDDSATAVLDLSAVESFDSAGVQLLLALRNSLANRAQVLRCQSPSAVVTDALRTYGLQGLLGTQAGERA